MKEAESIIENRFAAQCVHAKVRVDGRAPLRARRVHVSLGDRNGNAEVTMERTRAAATARIVPISPSIDRPAEGVLTLSVELSPASSEAAARGASSGASYSDDALSLRATVERIVRDARALDLDALCIVAGIRVWSVVVHVDVVCDDGNCVDAATLAAMAALLHARRPDVTVRGRDVVIHPTDQRDPLPLPVHHVPIATSFALFKAPTMSPDDDDVPILDPTRRETLAADGALTVACNALGDVCAVSKAGGLPLAPVTLVLCAKVAEERAREVTEILADALGDDAQLHPLAVQRPLLSTSDPAVAATTLQEKKKQNELSAAGAWNATPAADTLPPKVDTNGDTNGTDMQVNKWPPVAIANALKTELQGDDEILLDKEDGEISSIDDVVLVD